MKNDLTWIPDGTEIHHTLARKTGKTNSIPNSKDSINTKTGFRKASDSPLSHRQNLRLRNLNNGIPICEDSSTVLG